MNLVDNNLKTAAALRDKKPELSLIPPVAEIGLALALSNGAEKYGRYNWRGSAVTASVFASAMKRHINAWLAGEDFASDSNIHHLAHVMAGCAIVLDSVEAGVFKDDRVPNKLESFDKILKG
jgi:hypothetical protein